MDYGAAAEHRKKEEGMMKKLIHEENTDMIIIDTDGVILFDDIGNYDYFGQSVQTVRGQNIRQLFTDLPEDYPLLKAVREGTATKGFNCRLTTKRKITIQKEGDAYPLYDGKKCVGAIEFTHFYYNQDRIRDIERHMDNVFYRSNHTKYTLENIITQDVQMERIKAEIENIAIFDSNVLIYGETGTGKELIAQAIHNGSRRYMKKFISQNCGAIPSNLLEGILFGTTKGAFTGAADAPGLFEMADGGTIFLDEINSLDIQLQLKLLKTIESKTVRRIGAETERRLDFRVIAATNEEPAVLLRSGKMKPDLFYRLAIVYFALPNLIEREGDLELLTRYFIDYFNRKMNRKMQYPSEDLMETFRRYDWPGNVRELRNVIEGVFIFAEGDCIRRQDIPEYILRGAEKSPLAPEEEKLGIHQRRDLLEQQIVQTIYEENGRSLALTAQALGISKSLLRQKLNKIENEK